MGEQIVASRASLSAEALRGVIEELSTHARRHGLRLEPHSLAQERDQLARQHDAGEVGIIFDLEMASVSVMRRLPER